MLNELKKETNMTYTENGAATFCSAGSECVDLFATIGALRSAEESEIVERFIRAWAEDRDLAMKMLFYCRDIRGGLGERRVFRILLKYLAAHESDSVRKNLYLVSEYGRWDDLMVLMDTPCRQTVMDLIKTQLEADQKAMKEEKDEVSLLAKWLPSVNASNKETVKNAREIASHLGMPEAQYRKLLVALRARIRIIENNLRERDYTFDYSKQPSKAMFKYRKAFIRNDGERYGAFMDRVENGEETLHTGTLMPYELVHQALNFRVGQEGRKVLDVTWKQLEDFTNGENALVVVDGSGSMYGGRPMAPIEVAMSLGIYFAEHNTGAFHNHFITFSYNPRLVEIKGDDLVDKVRYCETYNEAANTNIQKVFELILNTAVKNKLPQSELPTALYFITDMEFDYCTRDAKLTNFEYAKKLFEQNGYTLPKVVFWCVESRNQQQPVDMNEQGVILVSGATARIFSMVASGELNPYAYMISILGGERYAPVSA